VPKLLDVRNFRLTRRMSDLGLNYRCSAAQFPAPPAMTTVRSRLATCRYRKLPAMNSAIRIVRAFLVSEDGPTAVEYAVMLALIVLACIASIKALGTATNDQFTAVKNGLAAP
jgi:pilus assembly protein Flp/PilA